MAACHAWALRGFVFQAYFHLIEVQRGFPLQGHGAALELVGFIEQQPLQALVPQPLGGFAAALGPRP
jgi:hypothetical protein